MIFSQNVQYIKNKIQANSTLFPGEEVTEAQELRNERRWVVGLPSDSLADVKGLPAQALKGKPLGHVLSVMFWNSDQYCLLKFLRKGESCILLADYGCGKTSILMAAAIMAAEDLGTTVYFISAANWGGMRVGCDTHDIVIDQALKLKFRGTHVQVITANELCGKVCSPNFVVNNLY